MKTFDNSRPIKRVSLSDTIIEELNKIIASKYKPGDRLPTENELAKNFGVGRSSIREALKVLSKLGIVERRNEGTFVFSSPKDYLVEPLSLLVQMEHAKLSDIVEMREMLELETVRLATKRATEEDILLLENIIWEMERPGLQTDEFITLDIEFHSCLGKAAGNVVISQTLTAIRVVLNRFHRHICNDPKVQEDAITLHKDMIQQIRKRNCKEARKVMEKHLQVARIFHSIPLGCEAED